ncbi:MAG: HAD family phosphatase [Candidatus Altiarchaeota archaeon]|nr:HAD family phosphatase [Candidatus Altiarchaeota archaeon]
MKAAIFDWDGTLVDSFPVAYKVFKQVLGDDFTETDLKNSFGVGAGGVVRGYFERKGIPYSEKKIKELAKEKTRVQVTLASETKVLPGVIETLDFLKKEKYRIAICSSNYKSVIDSVLKENGLSGYFEVIITGDNTWAKKLKPHPDIFLHTAEDLKLPPRECVVFEDSPMGIEAAKNAGMEVIGLCTGPFTRDEVKAKDPDLVVDSLRQLDEIKAFLGC